MSHPPSLHRCDGAHAKCRNTCAGALEAEASKLPGKYRTEAGATVVLKGRACQAIINKAAKIPGALSFRIANIFLQRADRPIPLLQRLDRARGGFGGGEGGDDRDLVENRHRADLALVGRGAFSRGVVDDELECLVLDVVGG